jgi:hypothetical protein
MKKVNIAQHNTQSNKAKRKILILHNTTNYLVRLKGKRKYSIAQQTIK